MSTDHPRRPRARRPAVRRRHRQPAVPLRACPSRRAAARSTRCSPDRSTSRPSTSRTSRSRMDPMAMSRCRIVRPAGATGALPVILYIHGAGWVFGNAHTHDRLVRELAVGTGAAVVFPDYRRSPEVRYPSALEESWTVARWIVAARRREGPRRVAHRGGRRLRRRQHERGADAAGQAARRAQPRRPGPLLPGHRRRLRHRLLPRSSPRATSCAATRCSGSGTSTPPTRPSAPRSRPRRCAPITEQLAGLPPALVITAEADVLRDEGEAYANKLREAGVPVTATRYQGIIHDFVMLNALRRDAGRAGRHRTGDHLPPRRPAAHHLTAPRRGRRRPRRWRHCPAHAVRARTHAARSRRHRV